MESSVLIDFLKLLELKVVLQKEVAVRYATIYQVYGDQADWTSINTAIQKRWSKSGLTRVKTMAWKIIDRKTNG